MMLSQNPQLLPESNCSKGLHIVTNARKNAISLKVALASASDLGTLFGQSIGARADFDKKVAEMVRDGAVDMATVVKGQDNDEVDQMIAAFFNAAATVDADLALNPDSAKTARSQYHAIAWASNNDNVDFPAVMGRVETLRSGIASSNRFTLHQCFVNVAVAQSAEFRKAKSASRVAVAVSDAVIVEKCTKKAKKDKTLVAFLSTHKKALDGLLNGKVTGLVLPDTMKEPLNRIVAMLDDMVSEDETDFSAAEKAELEAFRREKAEREAADAEAAELANAALASKATKPVKRDGKRAN